ncbi:MAG TPA: calcium/sodium antiporter [Verrucomicrobiae bacterium]
MLFPALLLLFGLVLLVAGARTMIYGATALATACGVSPLIIGLTIVAFGTSAPEVVVNTTAAFSGEPQLAFGNIVGSSAINLGWVLAITALVRPIKVERSMITREIPMMLLATAAFFILTADRLLDHASSDLLTRGNGIILLLLFGVFLYYNIAIVLNTPGKTQQEDPFAEEIAEHVERRKKLSTGFSLLLTLLGLAALVTGGRLTVFAAVKIATALGVPEFLIGLTIISFGTTLPELVTGILATRRGQGDIAIGNVVGSNIFNLLFIGGFVSVIRPIPVPPGGVSDLVILSVLSALVLPICIRGHRTVTRAEGAFLLVIYLGYMVWRVSTSH